MAALQPSQEDIVELERLIGLAERPNVKSVLTVQLKLLQNLLPKPEIPKPITISTPSSSQPQRSYTTISQYAWDNSDTTVKIYIDLDGVTPSSDVEATLSVVEGGRSLSIRAHDIKGKNYRLNVSKLGGKAGSVRVVKKSDKFVVVINKEGRETWTSLIAKEKEKEEPSYTKPAENADPGSSIMDMMKKLYDDGDDEMKRTITKAWSESQSKAKN